MGGGDGGGLNPLVIIALIAATGALAWWLIARSMRASGRFSPAAGEKPLPPPSHPSEPEPPPEEEPQPEAIPVESAAPPPEEPGEPQPANSALLAVPSRFVDDFRARMGGLSASLDGMVIRTGDRLQYAGIPLVVAAAGPAFTTVTPDTVVRVRRVAGDITAICPRCTTETILPAPACPRCSGSIVTELTDSGSPQPATRAIEHYEPEEQEAASPGMSQVPTEPGPSARPLTRDHWLALGGTLAVGLSVWLPWMSSSRSYNGFEIRLFDVFFDNHGEGGPTVALGLLLVALIGLVAAASAARSHRRPTDDGSEGVGRGVLIVLRLAGMLTVLFCLLFARRIWSTAGGFGDLFDLMGLAPLLAVAGAIAMIASTRRSSTLQSGT